MLAVTAESVSGRAMMNRKSGSVPPTSEVVPVVETGSKKKPVRNGSDIVEVENELALIEVEIFVLLLLWALIVVPELCWEVLLGTLLETL
jgi:hypothetical protein